MADLREACAQRFAPEEMELLDHAIAFAKEAHKDQKRESGEPYYTHPEAVAQMLFDMGMDSHTVIAGLLHDVVEDCPVFSLDTVRTHFGERAISESRRRYKAYQNRKKRNSEQGRSAGRKPPQTVPCNCKGCAW